MGRITGLFARVEPRRSRAKQDADQVRDDACGYVVEHPHDDRAVLVVEETGDVKKGTGTVGVQRRSRR